jgi:hypothetical protein
MRSLGSALLAPAMVAGAVAVASPAHTTAAPAPATIAAPSGGFDLVAHKDFQFQWFLDDGVDGYRSVLAKLRNVLADPSRGHGSTTDVVDWDGRRRAIINTDTSQNDAYADVLIRDRSDPDRTLHMRVRLSNLYVTQFYYTEGRRTYYISLDNNAPTSSNWIRVADLESGYDGLSRQASAPLVGFGVSTYNLAASRRVLMGTRNVPQMARAALRFIIAIAEASRIRPLSERITNNFQSSEEGYQLVGEDVNAMRSWGRLSDIFHGTKATVTAYGRIIDNARKAAILLLIALGTAHAPGTTPKTEL